ncbi:MAG: SH3 domain-containing protein [Anaerolineales bacterium]|nr:SH3 domain-containing protein [Anaerolineales bacterium]MBK8821993.1 SH3 domain-containing protein [Anaerolineales bacterium]
MKRPWFHPIIFIPLIVLLSLWTFSASTLTVVLAQQPTETPAAGAGMFITVVTDEPQINVRLGPSSSIYPIVGTLLRGATAPALGRSSGGDWIQIEYPGAPNNKGWVYSPLVQVSPGVLLLVEPPPTPAQPPTATIDPTLAAQFNIIPTNTRLPTFTPPPSLVITVYTPAPSLNRDNSVPLGIIIAALAILGVIGFFLSVFIRR